LSYQFHATAAARDRGPFENKFGELCAIMGDKKAKEIVERNESLLQNVSGITATFAAVVNVMGGGENGTQRAKNIVDQNPQVLKSADERGRFRELTEIMGGGEEGARKIVYRSPKVLGSADVLGRFRGAH
jgi:hypothetical protein